MPEVHLTINDIDISAAPGTTILEAARDAGIKIPTLCYHPDQKIKADCRLCVVEIKGQKSLKTSCDTRVAEGMVVKTNSPRVIEARKTILELIFARHSQDCLHCSRNGHCELQDIAAEYDIRSYEYDTDPRNLPLDLSSPAIIRDPNKCILCGRCLEVCSSIQTVNALGYAYRGYNSLVIPSMGLNLSESPCVMCGQCIHVCPVGAISEREQIDDLLAAAADPTKIIVTQIAPAVRLAIAEEIGLSTGELPIKQLVTALRRAGINYVLHTNFTADLTIMEEGNELLKRVKQGGVLPMMTSCCPSWIRFAETFYPECLDHLSTCKSPQQMFGSLVKTYWADQMGIDPANIYSVSIMPCTAKKYEALRPEMENSGYRDVDLVLTTREVARLFKMMGIDPVRCQPSEFDPWMSEYSGAAVLFGTTGGVMEAALRTVSEVVSGNELNDIEFIAVRGMEGIREAEVDINGLVLKLAIVHGLSNARHLMEQVKAGKSSYHFIEVMSCPGGCIGGGGQPFTKSNEKRVERNHAIYAEDKDINIRKSHKNKEIEKLYEKFLDKPLGEMSHKLLHTDYCPVRTANDDIFEV